MYYMGVSGGTSWRAVAGLRSPWTGRETLFTYDSQQDPRAVIDLMVVAGKLRRKWAAEGANLPALGYGQLGVCNDSTAVLELSAEGSISIYPLAHPLIEADGDEINDLLADLPADLFGEPDPQDVIRRIKATLPTHQTTQPFPKLIEALDKL